MLLFLFFTEIHSLAVSVCVCRFITYRTLRYSRARTSYDTPDTASPTSAMSQMLRVGSFKLHKRIPWSSLFKEVITNIISP